VQLDLGAPANDLYIRLNRDGVGAYPARAVEGGGIVFVDYRRNASLAALRGANLGRLAEPALIIIRAADVSSEEALQEAQSLIANQMGVESPIAILEQSPGQAFRLAGAEPFENGQVPEMTARARAVEFRAMLEWGRAIWRPERYHYRLPSGLHSGTFVKVADAIREPHDADAIASWFSPLMTDRLGIVLDSGTLSSVVLAISRRMRAAGMELGHVAILDRFQHTVLEAQRALLYANQYERSLMAVLSANASGHLRSRVWQAFTNFGELAGSSEHPRIHVLVDAAPAREVPEIETWLPLPGEPPVVEAGLYDRDCPLCNEGPRKYLVGIAAGSFNPIVDAERRLLVPSVADANRNRAFWELCDAANAIGIEEAPVATRPFVGKLPIRIRFDHLLHSPPFRAAVRARLDIEWHRAPADLVIVAEREARLTNPDNAAENVFDHLWTNIQERLATPEAPLLTVLDDGEWSADVRKRVREARRILLFALGTVTGNSLQRALTAIQSERAKHDRLVGTEPFEVYALVLHARPVSDRDWQTLRNSFGADRKLEWYLQALWTTYLPDTSPVEQELVAIDGLTESLAKQPAVLEFLESRKDYRQPLALRKGRDLFWYTKDGTTVTPNSLFGTDVHGPTVYAALASAVQRARLDEGRQQKPATALFEMPAIVRSYYDPMIIAAIMRWLDASEIWWGRRPEGAERIVTEVLHRARDRKEQFETLLSEFLLAGAQGKLGTQATNVVVTMAESFLDRPDKGKAADAPIRLGLALCRTRSAPQAATAWVAVQGSSDEGRFSGFIVEVRRSRDFSLPELQVALLAWMRDRASPPGISVEMAYKRDPAVRQELRVELDSPELAAAVLPRVLRPRLHPLFQAVLEPLRSMNAADAVAFLRERAAFLLNMSTDDVVIDPTTLSDDPHSYFADVRAEGSAYRLRADGDHIHLDAAEGV
jgi:hypothetical protein